MLPSRLKQLIETSLGAEVVMTRTDDTFVPLGNAHGNSQRAASGSVHIHSRQFQPGTIRARRGNVLSELHIIP